ncbi:translocase of outer mitochondrial membrane [Clonorchis sinensis]|uniref:Mitochondrial import receptor subunit TOM40 n=2 Tax=Clonorchis sinensis TaxID=79923 RepID=H2KQR8_CLOSI|nr:translocase of outer mitochondrial membrane [Clonorchis sinensis]GAA41674.1 mitochondrial import receptor subunit TOM40 [Clonorchis sinensis]
MGNVVRAASPQGDAPKQLPVSEGSEKTALPTEGPGTIETIHNKAHEVFPVPFDGAKLVINKGLSQNFQVNHSLSLCNDEQGGYRFGVTYVGHQKVSETESYPILMGELQPNGNLQAHIIHRLTPLVYIRYAAQAQRNKMVGQQLVTELKAKKWQTAFTIVNPDINRGQAMAAVDIMKQVSSRVALGSMFFYQRSPQLPSKQNGVWSIGGKYTSDNWQACATLRPWQLGIHTSLHLQVNESLQLAAELESSHQQQTNTTTLGYKYDIPKANVTFKAQLDSNWNIASSLEKKLTPFPFTFTLCALGNQTKAKYAFGIGLMVG